MVLQEGPASLFYACPKYHSKNRSEGERACNNRLSIGDFFKALEALYGKIIEAELQDERLQLTNYEWKDRKGTRYKVLKQEGDKLTISVYNKKAINTYPRYEKAKGLGRNIPGPLADHNYTTSLPQCLLKQPSILHMRLHLPLHKASANLHHHSPSQQPCYPVHCYTG